VDSHSDPYEAARRMLLRQVKQTQVRLLMCASRPCPRKPFGCDRSHESARARGLAGQTPLREMERAMGLEPPTYSLFVRDLL
jgi:hypothetical protein